MCFDRFGARGRSSIRVARPDRVVQTDQDAIELLERATAYCDERAHRAGRSGDRQGEDAYGQARELAPLGGGGGTCGQEGQGMMVEAGRHYRVVRSIEHAPKHPQRRRKHGYHGLGDSVVAAPQSLMTWTST